MLELSAVFLQILYLIKTRNIICLSGEIFSHCNIMLKFLSVL